jgi:hypothetical protein
LQTLEKLEIVVGEAEKRSRSYLSGKEYVRNKQEDKIGGWRKDRCNTKSSDDQKHSHRNKYCGSHTTYRSLQRPRTDQEFQHKEHDKQDVHSLGRSICSEKSETFQKPTDELDMSGRESTSRQDVSRRELGGVSTSLVSGNWRRKVADNIMSSGSPNSLKSSSCEEREPYIKTQSSSPPLSSSESEDEKKNTSEVQLILTDKEMNDLGARLVKAEILGNEVCIDVISDDEGLRDFKSVLLWMSLCTEKQRKLYNSA